MNQEKINRINELYKKQKAGTITPEEKDEQSLLRAEYIAAVRNNLRNTLEHTAILYPKRSVKRKAERLQNGFLLWKNFKKQMWFCHINRFVQKWKRQKLIGKSVRAAKLFICPKRMRTEKRWHFTGCIRMRI